MTHRCEVASDGTYYKRVWLCMGELLMVVSVCACGMWMCVLKSQRLSSWYWHSSSSAYDTFALNWIFVFRVDSLQFCKHNTRWCPSVQHINNYADSQYSTRSHLKGCVLCTNWNTIKSIRNEWNQLCWEQKKNIVFCFCYCLVFFFLLHLRCDRIVSIAQHYLWLNEVMRFIFSHWNCLIFCGYN